MGPTQSGIKSVCMTYTITIATYLDACWSEWFDDLVITHNPAGTTTLTGTIPDQARLFTILCKIRDMNLILIKVEQIVAQQQ